MIPDACQFCKGTLNEGKTDFIARVDDQVVLIRNVSAYLCNRCGESWFSLETSEKIDQVMNEVHAGHLRMKPLAAGEIELPA